MNEEDRKRFHELLDYAIDTNQDYVIMQYAEMNLNFQIKRELLRLRLKKEYDVS